MDCFGMSWRFGPCVCHFRQRKIIIHSVTHIDSPVFFPGSAFAFQKTTRKLIYPDKHLDILYHCIQLSGMFCYPSKLLDFHTQFLADHCQLGIIYHIHKKRKSGFHPAPYSLVAIRSSYVCITFHQIHSFKETPFKM